MDGGGKVNEKKKGRGKKMWVMENKLVEYGPMLGPALKQATRLAKVVF